MLSFDPTGSAYLRTLDVRLSELAFCVAARIARDMVPNGHPRPEHRTSTLLLVPTPLTDSALTFVYLPV
jgi:hypothetical protein